MKIECISLVGDRDENQDFCLHWAHRDIAAIVVADGLGGHQGGALASRLLCEGLRAASSRERLETLLAADDAELARHCGAWLEAGAEHMRAAIRLAAPGTEPLTTCALALSAPRAVVVAHIGDSRLYRLNTTGVLWRTRDHSVVQMLVDEGEIVESAMGTHPDQGKLFRAIGMNGEVKPTVRRDAALSDGEALLACSDGFWERVQPEELAALVRGEYTVAELAQLAERRAWGKSDNVTAVLLRAPAAGGWKQRVRKLLGAGAHPAGAGPDDGDA